MLTPLPPCLPQKNLLSLQIDVSWIITVEEDGLNFQWYILRFLKLDYGSL